MAFKRTLFKLMDLQLQIWIIHSSSRTNCHQLRKWIKNYCYSFTESFLNPPMTTFSAHSIKRDAACIYPKRWIRVKCCSTYPGTTHYVGPGGRALRVTSFPFCSETCILRRMFVQCYLSDFFLNMGLSRSLLGDFIFISLVQCN